nr:MAG TPA: KilA-N domain [Caudoviricetes sp.]
MNAQISVANVSVRQFNGLYSINDLHRAAGKERRHEPHAWLRSQQAVELIKELEKTQNCVIQSKQGLGTFVSKELVVHYGMWISPAFSLKVIRAFLDTQEEVSGSPKLETQTTIDERRGLVNAVKLLVARCGIDYSAAYRMVHQRFGVAHIDQIAAPLLPAAVAYVHSLVLQGRPLVDEVELETVPKLFRHQANLPFDLNDEGRFDVTVHNGKIYRHRITYSKMNFIDEQIPCLRHQVSR